jgi:hypothetical protein
VAIIGTIAHTFNYNRDFYIPAEKWRDRGGADPLVAGE